MKWPKRQKSGFQDPVGDIRPSQMLHSYGIGALADLPHLSVILLGIDSWDETDCEPIHEERLLRAVKARLGPQVGQLRLPPVTEERESPGYSAAPAAAGIPVEPFPRWLRCAACHRLLDIEQGQARLERKSGSQPYYVHENCNERRSLEKSRALPVRFVVACRSGHLDDFPWVDYVHDNKPCGSPSITMHEGEATGDATQIRLSCLSCRKTRRLADALGRQGSKVLPECSGRHPHLLAHDGEACTANEQRVIALGASNLWFPRTESALSIPHTKPTLWQIVASDEVLMDVQDAAELGLALRLRNRQKHVEDISAYSEAEILQTVLRIRAGEEPEVGSGNDLRQPEYEVLSAGEEISEGHFCIRYLPAPTEYAGLIEQVGLLDRLREVRAFVGFTRIEPGGDDQFEPSAAQVPIAGISADKPKWVPACEVRGEGLFIQFNAAAIAEWARDESVIARNAELQRAHHMWRESRGIANPESAFPGIEYVLLHSFSHALTRQLAVECGYSAASIRERIYCRFEEGELPPMTGVLLYTAATDSEGTLGGLVSLGEPEQLGRLISAALDALSTCPSDPLCSEHDPADDVSLHGAACHSCSFIAETSCERANRYLDRATVVQTLGDACRPFF